MADLISLFRGNPEPFSTSSRIWPSFAGGRIAARNRYAERLENGFGLVFVIVHMAAGACLPIARAVFDWS
jgi:hypothetical protein